MFQFSSVGNVVDQMVEIGQCPDYENFMLNNVSDNSKDRNLQKNIVDLFPNDEILFQRIF